MFDTDGDGLISFPEYLFFVTLLSLTDEQCKATFREFDVDRGRVAVPRGVPADDEAHAAVHDEATRIGIQNLV
jgi:hypothetical protein